MHRISIPKGARAVLLNFRYENHEAYVVGGCVRDSLLGKEPKDWDICTSATPDEVKELMHRRGIKTMALTQRVLPPCSECNHLRFVGISK